MGCLKTQIFRFSLLQGNPLDCLSFEWETWISEYVLQGSVRVGVSVRRKTTDRRPADGVIWLMWNLNPACGFTGDDESDESEARREKHVPLVTVHTLRERRTQPPILVAEDNSVNQVLCGEG